ncbi:hypothetical protein [Bradyrhizobium sp. LjRoot220]|uniref:hypothetical protein n=1 Tax=Bradyrhizobium sp. LjRoot220 TaxID=3342284 RepID=UPI003F4F91A7
MTAKAALVNRFWLRHYPDGMPADVDVSQYSLLVELFEERFARFADSKAAISMDKAITYGEHRQDVMRHRSAKQMSREKGPHCGRRRGNGFVCILRHYASRPRETTTSAAS